MGVLHHLQGQAFLHWQCVQCCVLIVAPYKISGILVESKELTGDVVRGDFLR